jgi:hypothetical protein
MDCQPDLAGWAAMAALPIVARWAGAAAGRERLSFGR